MRDDRDPLEVELAALRPQAVSPALRQRIAERIAGPVPVPRRRWRWLAVAGSLAAACLAVGVWGLIGNQRTKSPRESAGHGLASSAAIADAAPTLLAYQRALSHSPEELEVLLNKHALVMAVPDSQLMRVGAFARSDAALHALLGDD